VTSGGLRAAVARVRDLCAMEARTGHGGWRKPYQRIADMLTALLDENPPADATTPADTARFVPPSLTTSRDVVEQWHNEAHPGGFKHCQRQPCHGVNAARREAS
jgi:hypothetical protein